MKLGKSHTLDTTKLQYVFDGIKKNLEKLNAWETDFITSLYGRWITKQELTDAQLKKLEEIWVKIP